MADRRRYLSLFAVLSLVLLRLVIGWHFFREGSQKVVYDRHDVELRMSSEFSAEGFLAGAKGPLAGWYQANVPHDHQWRELLAAPRRNVPPQESPPYADWAQRIRDDWAVVVEDLKRIPAFTDEQEKQADEQLKLRTKQLEEYLAANADAIAEYRHELWRLKKWRESPETGEVPFHDERIAVKEAETAQTPTIWVSDVRRIEADLYEGLQDLLTEEQRGQALTTAAVEDAFADSRHSRLNTINVLVTILTIGVGICLLTGLFTRLAAILGALFLLGVILSQPPWLPEAAPTMPQVIEFAGLLVLAGTGAGRWLGLDFFTYSFFHRTRRSETPVSERKSD